ALPLPPRPCGERREPTAARLAGAEDPFGEVHVHGEQVQDAHQESAGRCEAAAAAGAGRRQRALEALRVSGSTKRAVLSAACRVTNFHRGATMDLTTTYLGLTLRSPLVPSASPLSEEIDSIRRMEDAGAAAVVLYSL